MSDFGRLCITIKAELDLELAFHVPEAPKEWGVITLGNQDYAIAFCEKRDYIVSRRKDVVALIQAINVCQPLSVTRLDKNRVFYPTWFYNAQEEPDASVTVYYE